MRQQLALNTVECHWLRTHSKWPRLLLPSMLIRRLYIIVHLARVTIVFSLYTV